MNVHPKCETKCQAPLAGTCLEFTDDEQGGWFCLLQQTVDEMYRPNKLMKMVEDRKRRRRR